MSTTVAVAPTPGSRTRPGRSPARTFVLALAGILLVQLAWILCVPPFAGIDEHDHAFKAAAVAHGDFSPTHEASPGGWGELVQVPASVVAAARAECEALVYTTVDNCRPNGSVRDGMATVGSSASRYNPGYYAVVGVVGLPFEGAAALYAMRAASSLLCALLLAAALTVTQACSRTSWPATTVVLAATPVLLYSSTVVAPNGLEMSAAVLCWCALLAMVDRVRIGAPHGWLLLVATVAAVPMVTVRTLGPLWCLLTVLTVAALLARRDLPDLLRRRSTWVCASVVATATAGALAWSVLAATNMPTERTDVDLPSVVTVLPREMALWVFQSVAAFPSRNHMAPLLVYAAVFVGWWVTAGLAVRHADRRQRGVLALAVLLAAVVPTAATVATYPTQGALWQGRYGLPFAVGLILLCGAVLDRRRAQARTSDIALWVMGLLTAVAGVSSVWFVRGFEIRTSPQAGSEAWATPSRALLATLVVLGVTLVVAGARRRPWRDVPGEDMEQAQAEDASTQRASVDSA
ncbi:MAG: DUF2142 domain-containing protein [Nocardioides sp.]|nr:DUF2142 domain-containing protein [Nocardioides sp.]